jgi:hypothetical protein
MKKTSLICIIFIYSTLSCLQRGYTQRCINPEELHTLSDFFDALEEYRVCTDHCLENIKKEIKKLPEPKSVVLAKSEGAYFFYHRQLGDFIERFPGLEDQTVYQLVHDNFSAAHLLYHDYFSLTDSFSPSEENVISIILKALNTALMSRKDELEYHQQQLINLRKQKEYR